ncbi:hypothetical protein ABZW11_36885 [Nonomuraea sp. NPDC004580]|uniref:hypothetical protein n=1 Tax=Nonomuraea sp. NPDC004580 TaxID=3154552 RepID=UPI0033A96503
MPLVKRITPALVTALLAAGCTGAAPASPRPAAPPPGVTVSLAQYRSDEPVHVLQVAVRNIHETPVYFADVQLVTASFTTLPPQRADATIRKTARTDLPLTYGPANCPPTGLPEVAPATVVARVGTGGEPPRAVAFPVPHPDPLLARLLRDECSEHLVKQAVTIEFGPEWKQTGSGSDAVMRGDLVVTRRGPGVVRLTSMGGTTHYIAEHPEPLGTLDAEERQVRLPIRLTPGRCDAHAFAEAKKAFLFPIRVTLDGGDERVVIVTPPKPLQDSLIQYAARTCGLPQQ